MPKHLSTLDKTKKYTLVGISKSGTTSLCKYLASKGFDVDKRDGWFWIKKWREEFGMSQLTKDRVPLIVTRDPVERAWSHYHYMFQTKPVEETDEYIKYIRLEEVSRKSHYIPWLSDWLRRFPDTVIIHYEDFVSLPDFPHENATKVKPEITTGERFKIVDYILAEAEDGKLFDSL